MHDQANDLRQLVRFDAGHMRRHSGPSPQLIAVSSGKGGVGTTTIAVNLAVALASAGRSCILVDADLDGPDVAGLCRMNENYSLAHVLSGARSVHEALCRGPGGIQILPGAWAPGEVAECPPMAQERLIAALRGLGDYADFVVLDIGSGLNRVVRRFWHAADRVLLVTTPEDNAVMNAYAAIKVLADGDPQLPVSSVVNLAPDGAAEVHERLARACQRFLGMRLAPAGSIPASQEVVSAARSRQPFVIDAPACAASQGMERLAENVIASVGRPSFNRDPQGSADYPCQATPALPYGSRLNEVGGSTSR